MAICDRILALGAICLACALARGQEPHPAVSLPMAGSVLEGRMAITIGCDAPAGELVTSTLEWSTDGGFSWELVTLVAPSAASNPDVGRTAPFSGIDVTWDTVADGIALDLAQEVQIRVTAESDYGLLSEFPQVLPMTRGPLAMADLDRDGDLDVALGTWEFRVHLNDGLASFAQERYLSYSVLCTHVALADMDGDLDDDALVCDAFGPHLHRNDGAGNFVEALTQPASPNTFAMLPGDFDGDGRIDFLALEYQRLARIYFNIGGGSFTAATATIPIENLPGAFLSVDLDGDGDLDVVTPRMGGGVAIHKNDGLGGLIDSGQVLAGGSTAGADDLDADGDLDLVLATSSSVAICLNPGNGIFLASAQILDPGAATEGIGIADFDGDGNLDLYLGAHGRNSLWHGDGNGGYTLHDRAESGFSTSTIWVADLDGDGDPDVVEGRHGQSAGILLNDGQASIAGDAIIVGLIADNRPRPSISAPLPASIVSSDVPCQVTIANPARLSADTVFDWSRDGGVSWNLATAALTSASANPDLARPFSSPVIDFRWDSVADGVGLSGLEAVDLRVVTSAAQPVGQMLSSASTIVGGSSHSNASVWLHDLDGNGAADLIRSRSTIRIWLSDGNGGMFAQSPQAGGGVESDILAAADFDRDGDLDLVTPATPGSLLWNDGNAVFTPVSMPFVGVPAWMTQSPRRFATGDINNDGWVDLLMAFDNGRIAVWGNSGLGTFVLLHDITRGPFPTSIELADFDGDADLDLAQGNSQNPGEIWWNNGSGIFADSGQRLSTNSWFVNSGDLDGNGNIDLLINGFFFANNGAGIMTPRFTGLGGIINASALADLDDDGDLDLATSDQNSIILWQNDGAGFFTATGETFGQGEMDQIAVGDVDGDGIADVAGSGYPHARIHFSGGIPREDRVAVIVSNPASCLIVAAPLPGAPSAVEIQLDLASTMGSMIDLVVEWSSDGGATFAICTPAIGSPSPNPRAAAPLGASTLLWDAAADGVGTTAPQNVILRATVTVSATIMSGFCTTNLIVVSGCSAACGDCQPDGRYDIIDALQGARISVGILMPTRAQTFCCDVDGSGVINTIDVLFLAQRALGWPVGTSCR